MSDGYANRIYEVTVDEGDDTTAFTVLAVGESPDDAMDQIREEWPHAAVWIGGLRNEELRVLPPAPSPDAMSEVEEELKEAISRFPSFVSPHEGWAIIKEEVDELWEEVRRQYDVRDRATMRKEAKQVAAMALRFMIDLC